MSSVWAYNQTLTQHLSGQKIGFKNKTSINVQKEKTEQIEMESL